MALSFDPDWQAASVTASTSITVDCPAGSTGDVLIAAVSAETSTLQFLDDLDGFDIAGFVDDDESFLYMLTRVRDGSEGSTFTFTTIGANNKRATIGNYPPATYTSVFVSELNNTNAGGDGIGFPECDDGDVIPPVDYPICPLPTGPYVAVAVGAVQTDTGIFLAPLTGDGEFGSISIGGGSPQHYVNQGAHEPTSDVSYIISEASSGSYRLGIVLSGAPEPAGGFWSVGRVRWAL